MAVNLKRRRLSLGLSQEAVALRAGLALSDVGRVERAERDPGIRVLAKIAYALELSPAQLLRGVRGTPPARQ